MVSLSRTKNSNQSCDCHKVSQFKKVCKNMTKIRLIRNQNNPYMCDDCGTCRKIIKRWWWHSCEQYKNSIDDVKSKDCLESIVHYIKQKECLTKRTKTFKEGLDENEKKLSKYMLKKQIPDQHDKDDLDCQILHHFVILRRSDCSNYSKLMEVWYAIALRRPYLQDQNLYLNIVFLGSWSAGEGPMTLEIKIYLIQFRSRMMTKESIWCTLRDQNQMKIKIYMQLLIVFKSNILNNSLV